MKSNHLLTEKSGAILSIMLNRPDRLNAFSPEMIQGLTETLREAQKNPDIRVVVLSGAGRSFCAGGDINLMKDAVPTAVYDHLGDFNTCILAMRDLEKPIIASVHGFAAGAGFNLVLASDLIFAAEDAQFILSFSQLGLVSDGGGSYFLPRVVGPYLAKELFFNAEPLTAQRAMELGIVNKLFPSAQLREETLAFAIKLAKASTKALGLIKKLVDRSFSASLEQILEHERAIQSTLVTSDDHQKAVKAFIEKRTKHQ